MSDPFLWSTGVPEVPPEPHKSAVAPVASAPTIEVPPAPKPEPPAPIDRCHHCGRRIRRESRSVIGKSYCFDFHDDRRACRAAARRSLAQDTPRVAMPPDSADDVGIEAYAVAAAGFDFVTLPWWLRWVPDAWLDGVRNDVAVKVGGIVERRCALKSNPRLAKSPPSDLGEEMRRRKLGVYRLHWRSGGSSVASVGMAYDGTRWYAPANWTTGSADASLADVVSTDWDAVERAELVEAYRNTVERDDA